MIRFLISSRMLTAAPGILAALALLTGCRSSTPSPSAKGAETMPPLITASTPSSLATNGVASATPGSPGSPQPEPAIAKAFTPVRIKAGGNSFTDSEGNVWNQDAGFAGGETIARPEIKIAETRDPDIYRSERYSMEAFSWPVPNGNYLVKLHFAETFDGITGPGQRVFSFNVQGREFKDFDVWQAAGGPLRAYVETVQVPVTNGLLKITFTPKVENPQINGIEILQVP